MALMSLNEIPLGPADEVAHCASASSMSVGVQFNGIDLSLSASVSRSVERCSSEFGDAKSLQNSAECLYSLTVSTALLSVSSTPFILN